MSSNLLLLFSLIILCAFSASADRTVDWWESATFYQIYPRSFMDSDGDGIGDLNGITSRLEYLKEIGVTAAWLSPIFDSPMADMGYDIANYTKISPLFGTMENFEAMLAKAHELGLKILLDFVPNHTSNESEWFQKSIRREDGYDDFYVWDDGKTDPETGERIPPSNWISAFNGSSWAWNEQRQQYYLHQFLVNQPDLNLTNPMVREQLIEVLKFWLDRNVDAFRIDAVPFFYETRLANGTYADQPRLNPIYTKDQPENPQWLYEWREFLDGYKKEHGGDARVQLVEAYSTVEVLSTYISNGTTAGSEMPMNFNFIKLQTNATAKIVEDWTKNWMDVIWAKHKVANWQLGNHDNSRPATRIGETKKDLMTMLVQVLPGATINYYGDEIGMTDGVCLPNCDFRDPERSPMQWDSSKNAGFSTGDSTWLPVNPNYEYLNVEAQRSVERSTLNIFKGMTELKNTTAFKAFKEEGGFSYGALTEQVFQVVRTAAGIEEYRFLGNFGNQTEYLDGLTNKTMVYVLLTSYSPHKYGDTVDLSGRICLEPHEAVILRWTA
ncbi:maltase A2-like [Anastrepha obliqua]|uniref:maltase A2-like n=1 Tax=Anastrepha obliqua TaxID=95512 RepID=UPI002409FBEE|nr:maltase A2-like [Anastrepha obliqua]